jgi:protocatechuate 3,4-dioxygenase beta subunit
LVREESNVKGELTWSHRYFKPSSPQRADLIEPDTKARLVEINGQVLARSCRPVARALVDLWYADERGEYDNASFRFMSL